LQNLEIRTADVNTFEPGATFDRIVSIEMLEHVRNHRVLFGRMAGWLAPEGLAFFHVFRHARFPYTFDTEGSGNWMGRHFFTGGIMPSADLLPSFQDALALVDRWEWDGTHYEKTSNAWLERLDARRDQALAILADHYGADEPARWLQRWRIFFMACAEMFGLDKGQEWGVSHYLVANR
jgi:cyclopropane-fatty-acyl-phospholipid synthase